MFQDLPCCCSQFLAWHYTLYSTPVKVTKADRTISKTLKAEEIQKMEFYSKFTPTSVTLSHFLDHSSGGGTVEDSFLFLRREIPVRLSNMMMELEVGHIFFVVRPQLPVQV